MASTPGDTPSSPSDSSLTGNTHSRVRTPHADPPHVGRLGPRNRRSSSNVTTRQSPHFPLRPAAFTSPYAATCKTIRNPESQETPTSPGRRHYLLDPPDLPGDAALPPEIPSDLPPLEPPLEFPPDPPPPVPAAPLSAPADFMATLPLFRGDGRDSMEPAEWFARFRGGLLASWSSYESLDRFQLLLYPGSIADQWFESLDLSAVLSMRDLQAAFLSRWPVR